MALGDRRGGDTRVILAKQLTCSPLLRSIGGWFFEPFLKDLSIIYWGTRLGVNAVLGEFRRVTLTKIIIVISLERFSLERRIYCV